MKAAGVSFYDVTAVPGVKVKPPIFVQPYDPADDFDAIEVEESEEDEVSDVSG